jgi:N-acetylglutamate synthase-like GNAT family acetyltransferase
MMLKLELRKGSHQETQKEDAELRWCRRLREIHHLGLRSCSRDDQTEETRDFSLLQQTKKVVGSVAVHWDGLWCSVAMLAVSFEGDASVHRWFIYAPSGVKDYVQ